MHGPMIWPLIIVSESSGFRCEQVFINAATGRVVIVIITVFQQDILIRGRRNPFLIDKHDIFYVVPLRSGMPANLRLYPHREPSKKYHLSVAKYEKYIDAWNLLDAE